MQIEHQLKFIKHPYGIKYRIWAKGVDELYALYEYDFARNIEEINVWQYRITIYTGQVFDFYPSSRKIGHLETKKWYTVAPEGLKKHLTFYKKPS
jgi:hypothetical protein